MQLEIVPFGKYKNQPVEVLKNDKQYLDWLNAQDWFKSRYQNIYNLVINNNYGQPAETPEHNKLVSLFLNDDFCEKFANLFIDKSKVNEKYLIDLRDKRFFSWKNGRVDYSDYLKAELYYTVEFDLYLKNIDWNNFKIAVKFDKFFELENGNDLRLDVTYSLNKRHLFEQKYSIECKPTVSEDYPAIIRQCKNQNSNVLLIENYNVQSITIEQMRKMFPFIKIILLSEIL